MSGECKWFVAEAIFQATVHTNQADVSPVSEDLLFLVQAVDHPSAISMAETIARAKQHSYENEKGQQVSWTFVRLVELTEMIDSSPQIYSVESARDQFLLVPTACRAYAGTLGRLMHIGVPTVGDFHVDKDSPGLSHVLCVAGLRGLCQ